jgi:hypothetical protein
MTTSTFLLDVHFYLIIFDHKEERKIRKRRFFYLYTYEK